MVHGLIKYLISVSTEKQVLILDEFFKKKSGVSASLLYHVWLISVCFFFVIKKPISLGHEVKFKLGSKTGK